MSAALRYLCLFLLVAFAWLPNANANEFPFNDGWQFTRREAGAPDHPPASARWSDVTLPHTARVEPRIVNDQWQGIAFYRKRFDVPSDWRGKVLLLRFEGAMNVATVWINGREVAHHLGGYLPFTIDLGPWLRVGANDLLVRLDNRDNPITGPKPLKDLDFNMYGGLYRDVRLEVKPPVYLTDEMLADKPAAGGLFVTYPEASTDRAVVRITADVRNSLSERVPVAVTHKLLDGGREVASATGIERVDAASTRRFVTDLIVPKPRLWSPKSPKLYRLVTTVARSELTADTTETRIGIRRIGIEGDRFVINGEKMFLRGVNRHQEYPYVGYALSPQADYRDAKRIKEAGFDYVRLSHYPHSRAFMDAADELGLVLLDSIPGWQFYNPEPRFRAHVLQTCRDMIRRDRNHPSVFAWECSLNESAMPKEFVQQLNRVVHEEFPGDQTWSAGWQNDGYDIFLQARQHRQKHYETPDRPYIVSEYGDWEYYAQNAGLNQAAWANLKEEERTSRQSLGSGEKRLLQQALNIQEAHNDNFRTPAFADGYWDMFDYNRGYAPDLELSGVMSLERLPKFSYWFFRSQRDASEKSPLFDSGAMVKIASYWTPQSSTNVRVFSNADEVELILNGRSLGRQQPVRDIMSGKLAHPPFEFAVAKFQPGLLQANAYVGGVLAATDRVETPSDPVAVSVSLDTSGIPAANSDLIFTRAHIVDRQGRTISAFNGSAQFEASGDFTIVGDRDVPVEGGIGSALVRVARANPGGAINVTSGPALAGKLVVSDRP
jgi:beta-galactosidase